PILCYSCISVLCVLCAHLALHSFPTRRSSDLSHHVLLVAAAPVPRGLKNQGLPAEGEIGLSILSAVCELADVAQMLFGPGACLGDRKSTRLNSSHQIISYAVFCLKKKKNISID